MSLDRTVANNILDAINGVDTFDAPTAPMKMRLLTANGSATANGTELGTGAGGGSGAGYVAGGAAVTFGSAASGAGENSAVVRWDNMPSCTITGAEVWDSAGTPKRYQYGAFGSPIVVDSGESFELPVGNIDETMA